jgi:uncharacterized membrane protein AbrB (regulator of aidB expression)
MLPLWVQWAVMMVGMFVGSTFADTWFRKHVKRVSRVDIIKE